MSAEEIDRYLADLDPVKRATLNRLRALILDLVPEAEQGISYGVPAFWVDGKVVAGFSAAKHHLSYLPHSGSVLSGFVTSNLEGVQATKGALKFPVDMDLPEDLVAGLIAARRAELQR